MARKVRPITRFRILLPASLVLGSDLEIPAGLRRREKYIDVASPSAVALVATITSETSLSMRQVKDS